jgi:hypothetical protein
MAKIMDSWNATMDNTPDAFVEMWPFGQNIICWTEDFKYKVLTPSGGVVWEGQLDQTLPEKTIALLQINCVWFCPMAGNKMMYVAFTAENTVSLRLWDFTTKTGTDFAVGLNVARDNFHNFCWVHYNTTTDKVQLAWQGTGEKSHYVTVAQGETGAASTEFDLNNACIFSVWNNSLYTANNFGDPKTIKVWGLHADGTVSGTTMVFKAESAYTIQEFGWLKDNWFYMVTIEGECGKSKKLENRGHTAGACVVFCESGKLPVDATVEEEGGMDWVWMDQAEEENGVCLPDGFFMMDRINMSLYATCSNDQFVRWDWKQNSQQKWECTKDKKIVQKPDLPNYCVGWDKQFMFAFEQRGTDVRVQVTAKLNPRTQYFWLLAGLTGVPLTQGQQSAAGWQWVALKDAIDLLAPKN